MNENEMVNGTNEVTVSVTGPSEVMLPEAPAKQGLTAGQKAIGGSVIGLAIVGIVSLVLWIVNGVKKAVSKIKAKKVEAPAAPAAQPAPEPAPQSDAAQTQASETPETK